MRLAMALRLSSRSVISRRPSIASISSGSTSRRACSASERLNNFGSFSSWSMEFVCDNLGLEQRFSQSILSHFDARLHLAVPLSSIAARISSAEAGRKVQNSGAASFTPFVKGADFPPVAQASVPVRFSRLPACRNAHRQECLCYKKHDPETDVVEF